MQRKMQNQDQSVIERLLRLSFRHQTAMPVLQHLAVWDGGLLPHAQLTEGTKAAVKSLGTKAKRQPQLKIHPCSWKYMKIPWKYSHVHRSVASAKAMVIQALTSHCHLFFYLKLGYTLKNTWWTKIFWGS